MKCIVGATRERDVFGDLRPVHASSLGSDASCVARPSQLDGGAIAVDTHGAVPQAPRARRARTVDPRRRLVRTLVAIARSERTRELVTVSRSRARIGATTMLVAMSIALAGCLGAVDHGAWTRPDTDGGQRARDEYECDRTARLSHGAGAYDRSRGAPGLAAYEACMKEKGYSRVH